MNRKAKRRARPATPKRRTRPKPRRSASKKKPVPVIDDSHYPPAEQIFSGPRPASMIRGLEPAFLLFEREILERIEARAAELGVRYESLVRQIVRDNLDRY